SRALQLHHAARLHLHLYLLACLHTFQAIGGGGLLTPAGDRHPGGGAPPGESDRDHRALEQVSVRSQVSIAVVSNERDQGERVRADRERALLTLHHPVAEE